MWCGLLRPDIPVHGDTTARDVTDHTAKMMAHVDQPRSKRNGDGLHASRSCTLWAVTARAVVTGRAVMAGSNSPHRDAPRRLPAVPATGSTLVDGRDPGLPMLVRWHERDRASRYEMQRFRVDSTSTPGEKLMVRMWKVWRRSNVRVLQDRTATTAAHVVWSVTSRHSGTR